MIISLRTLINTTLFWIIVLSGFWFYTKYDATPAKYLLYTIGRDNLGNIEITPSTTSPLSGTVENLSNQLIAERLANIEELCTRSVRLSIYDQPLPNTMPTTPYIPSPITDASAISTTGQKTIPIIDNSNILRQTPISQ